MKTALKPRVVLAIAGLAWTLTAGAQELPVTVQLSTPLSAGSSRKGDPVTAQVTAPDSMKGDTLRGVLSQVSSSRGQSVVAFTFDTLLHGGQNIPVAATIQAASSSKGAPGVDDRGQALRVTNVAAAKPTNASRFGGQLGGLIGGRTGQAVGDVGSDVNTSGAASSIQISTQGPALELGGGATLMLSAKTNGNGPSLSGLAPVAAPPNAAMTAAAPPSQARAAPQQTAAAQTAPAGAAGAQPELKSAKIEFVPGERVVFFEDFSDMAEDEPPPHWKVRNGTVELRTGGGIRELYSEKGVNLTSSSFDVPANFTLEADWTGEGQMTWQLTDKQNDKALNFIVRGEPDGITANTSVEGPDGELGSGGVEVASLKEPVHFALWAQQGRVRAYINGQRLVDANQVVFGPMDHIVLDLGGFRPNGLRQVRIAESAPDFSTMINSTGKYVTHGINFDTDSDRLKPDSAPMLKLVAAALAKNPNLKLEIDGYTDSVGKADHNLDLSKRRAQAVQSVLVSQFGIDADRLASNGFGPDKPIGSNDTPDGRANNRRVEFVKK